MCSLRLYLRSVRSFVHSAVRKISAPRTPSTYALATAAPLTLCALKTEVSMPALDRTDLIHLPTVEVVTSL